MQRRGDRDADGAQRRGLRPHARDRLRERPCRVIIESLRPSARRRSAGARRSLAVDGTRRAASRTMQAACAAARRASAAVSAALEVIVAVGRRDRRASPRSSRRRPRRDSACSTCSRCSRSRSGAASVAALVDRRAERPDAQLPVHHAAPPADDRPFAGRRRAGGADDRRGRRRPAGRDRSPARRRGREPRPSWPRRASARRQLLAEVASAILAGQSVLGPAREHRHPGRARDRREPRAGRARAGAVAEARTRSRCRCAPARAPRGCTSSTDTSWPVRDLERISEPLGPADRRRRRARAGRRAGGRDRGRRGGRRWPARRSCTRSRTICARR